MSELSESKDPVICRLCTSTKSGQFQIFGIEGENRRLYNKIKECLPIQVQNEDSLSKTVCQACISKVEDFYQFRQLCIRAQTLLKEDLFKADVICELTDAEAAEAEKIVECLQANRSDLSITPVDSSDNMKSDHDVDVVNTLNAFSITPILGNTESSGDDDSQWGSLPPFHSLPCLKTPSSEDYVLMLEETFRLDSPPLVSRQEVIEHYKKYEDHGSLKDKDVFETQFQRKVVLPPMWDVYERSADKENVTHRRYVVSKSSFPCSLCGACVAFHRQQSVLSKKQSHNLQEKFQITSDLSAFKHDLVKGRYTLNVQDDPSDLDQQLLKDLGVHNFSPQDVGMLDCPECGKLFPRRSSWKRHLRTHYEGRTFVCPVCGKGFNRKEHLSRHMISHTGGRPFRCDSCLKPFTRKEHLARHLACNVGCGNSAAGLISGIDQDYSTPRPYICDVCHQTFVRKEHMLRHRKRSHLLLDGYIPPTALQEDDVHPYSDGLNEDQTRSVSLGESKLNSDSGNNDPEEIEVEVNLLENSDEESMGEGEVTLTTLLNGISHPSIELKSVTNSEGLLDAELEDAELDQEDILRMKMNEAMRLAREGKDTSCDHFRCEVCQKTFTRKGHLVRHLRRFHPQVELAYAAACSVGNVTEGNSSYNAHPDQSSCSQIISQKDDDEEEEEEEEEDDDDVSFLSILRKNSSVSSSRSKGGQHPCSICGKMFGRRYHLVRHRRTQHGVESVEAGRIGRPPKCFLPIPPQANASNNQRLRCVKCGVQFLLLNDLQNHNCKCNNNTINKKIGSKTVAAMAAKISDKLLKGKDNVDHVCQSCGEKFCNKLELDKHVETHVEDLMEDMLWT